MLPCIGELQSAGLGTSHNFSNPWGVECVLEGDRGYCVHYCTLSFSTLDLKFHNGFPYLHVDNIYPNNVNIWPVIHSPSHVNWHVLTGLLLLLLKLVPCIQHPVQQTASVPPSTHQLPESDQYTSLSGNSSEKCNSSIEQIAKFKIHFSHPYP